MIAHRALVVVWLLCALLAHGCPSVAVAQSVAAADTTVQALREATVTGRRQYALGGSAGVQTLSGSALQGLSSTSIADAVKYFAGVQIKDYGGLGGLKTLNVRSLGAQHVAVFMDGVRITNAQNGTVDLGKFSLTTLESVSLSHVGRQADCQSAAEYASGATVYLRTRRPQTDSLMARVQWGSFHTYKAQAGAQFCRGGWSGFVDGEYLQSKGDYPFRYHSQWEDTIGVRRGSDIRYGRAEAGVAGHGVSAHLYYYDSKRGCPGGIVRRLSDKYTNVGREWDRDLFVQAQWQHRFSARHRLKLSGRYGHEQLRYCTDYPDNQNTAKVDNHYTSNDAYASTSYQLTMGEWLTVNAADDVRMTWYNADLKHFTPVRRLDEKAVVAVRAGHKGLELSASGIYQHFTTRSATGPSNLDRISPTVTACYTIAGVTLRAWYKDIFRVPTLTELYYTQGGARMLEPEETHQWNVGAGYQSPIWNNAVAGQWSISIQADAYQNTIANRIVCLPLKGTYTWSMMNYGRTFCQGLNATMALTWQKCGWEASLLSTATLQNDVNRTDQEDTDTWNRPICYSPRFSSGTTATIGWRWLQLTVSCLHVAERMWSYADPEDVLPPYDNLDARLTATWQGFGLSLDVSDVLDVQYEHIPRYPMPGRSFRLTLTYGVGKRKPKTDASIFQ